jgi:hypothetical protein
MSLRTSAGWPLKVGLAKYWPRQSGNTCGSRSQVKSMMASPVRS